MARWHVGDLIVDRLTKDFGFEVVSELGYYALVVDDQHAAVVNVQPHLGPSSAARCGLSFAVSRRDINELWLELISGTHGNWVKRPTVMEERKLKFFDQPDGHWLAHMNKPEDAIEWLDQWVPHLVKTVSLDLVEDFWDRVSNYRDRLASAGQSDPALTPATSAPLRIPQMMNRMLDGGWSDDAEERFIEPLVAEIEQLGPDAKSTPARKARLEDIRAWLAKHPDGLRRDLRSGSAT